MTPEGWREVRLDEAARVVGGGTPARSQPEFWDGDIPWATPTDVSQLRGRYLKQTASTISEAGLQSSSASLLPANSVLMTSRATIGACAINTIPMATNQGFQSLVPSAETDARFLAYSIAQRRNELTRLAAGSTFLEISRRTVSAIRIALPPLPEQRKIAAILSSVDDAIEATQAVIDQLQVVKKAMMAELLTRGLPGRHTRFKQTEIGEVPEEWEVVRLGECGRWLSGGTPAKNDPALWDGPIPWVSPKDMKRPRIGDAIDHVAEAAIGKGTQLASPGSVLMVVRGMILAHTFPVAIATRPVAFNQDIKVLVPSAEFDSDFLLYWLQRQAGAVLGAAETANHGTKKITTDLLFATPVPRPPLSVQRELAAALRAQDERLDGERQCVGALAALKAALLSVLLTGEVRVTPDPEGA